MDALLKHRLANSNVVAGIADDASCLKNHKMHKMQITLIKRVRIMNNIGTKIQTGLMKLLIILLMIWGENYLPMHTTPYNTLDVMTTMTA